MNRLLARSLPVYDLDWNCLVSKPEGELVTMWKRLMDSVDISIKSLPMVSPFPTWGGKRLMKVSHKAAVTAEVQTTELAGISSTISSTLGELKARSAQSAESASTLTSSILDSVSLLDSHSSSALSELG